MEGKGALDALAKSEAAKLEVIKNQNKGTPASPSDAATGAVGSGTADVEMSTEADPKDSDGGNGNEKGARIPPSRGQRQGSGEVARSEPGLPDQKHGRVCNQ